MSARLEIILKCRNYFGGRSGNNVLQFLFRPQDSDKSHILTLKEQFHSGERLVQREHWEGVF